MFRRLGQALVSPILGALASCASVADAQTCENVFHDPATGDPTTVSVLITSPAEGAERRAFAPACPEVTISGIASTIGIPPEFDFYVIIDVSGSTQQSSGVDIDGDGVTWGSGDSILAAEVVAARDFVHSLDMTHSRVALVSFSSSARLVSLLTSDVAILDAGLAGLVSGGTTDYSAAMETALAEHAARHDPSREQVIIFLSDGVPNEMTSYPPGAGPCPPGWANFECAALQWSEEAASRGLKVDTFAVGTGAASTPVLPEMARLGNGQFFSMTVAGAIIDILPTVIHVGIRDILAENLTTGDSVVVLPGPDGRFTATLPLVDGRNDLSVTATATGFSTWQARCETHVLSSCMEWGCPTDRSAECVGFGRVDGWLAWASEPSVIIEHDSIHADAPGADASGAYPLGPTDVSWRLSDPLAGEVTCTARLTVVDTAPPELAGVPPDARVSCPHVPLRVDPVATDACDAGPGLMFDERVEPGPCPDRFDVVRTWTATDASGNATSAEQRISVSDDTAPRLAGVPADATVSCDAVPPPPAVTAEDECDPLPSVAADETRVDGPCPSSYVLLRGWSTADRCGNSDRAVQRLEVRDDQAPQLQGVPADLLLDCRDAVPPPAPVTATDTCGPASVALAERRIPGACDGNYDVEREWTATDPCGNAARATQVIRVRDTTPPVVRADASRVTCLWPPRHDAWTLGQGDFGFTLEDDCSRPVSWAFVSCVSDQPDDGRGDGSTSGDCAISADGRSLLVRSERSGRGSDRHVGRRYSVSVVATDACGNSSAATPVGIIGVPHDQSDHDRTCAR